MREKEKINWEERIVYKKECEEKLFLLRGLGREGKKGKERKNLEEGKRTE